MLTMTREQFEGKHFIVLTPDNPAFPPVAIECTGDSACLAWNIHSMAANVLYVGKPRELDPVKVIARLNGELPTNADVSKE